MSMKFKKLSVLTITNEDPAFADSSYANEDFVVRIKPLNRTTLQKLNKECTQVVGGEEEVDQEKLGWKIFNHIYSSSDIEMEDEDGNIIEDGTDKYKKALYNDYIEFATCLTTAAIRFEEKCRVRDDEVKNG